MTEIGRPEPFADGSFANRRVSTQWGRPRAAAFSHSRRDLTELKGQSSGLL
jgi:hypothetical protein